MEAEGNVRNPRDALENVMRGYDSPRSLPGSRAARREVIPPRPRRLSGNTTRRRAQMAAASGGRLLPADA
jgi:hypothetical protein